MTIGEGRKSRRRFSRFEESARLAVSEESYFFTTASNKDAFRSCCRSYPSDLQPRIVAVIVTITQVCTSFFSPYRLHTTLRSNHTMFSLTASFSRLSVGSAATATAGPSSSFSRLASTSVRSLHLSSSARPSLSRATASSPSHHTLAPSVTARNLPLVAPSTVKHTKSLSPSTHRRLHQRHHRPRRRLWHPSPRPRPASPPNNSSLPKQP